MTREARRGTCPSASSWPEGGARIGADASNRPKPLVTVAGIPLLEINLRQLARLGVRTIHVAVHHQANAIVRWAKAHVHLPGVELRCITSYLSSG